MVRVVAPGSSAGAQVLRNYQHRTRAADALIAGAYVAGTNTRRVRRAVRSVFGGRHGEPSVAQGEGRLGCMEFSLAGRGANRAAKSLFGFIAVDAACTAGHGALRYKSLQVRWKDQRSRAAFMRSQSAAGDGDIEQTSFYPAFARGLFKSERDSVVVGLRIYAQPFADVFHNCCRIPTAITKSAIVPCCNHLG